MSLQSYYQTLNADHDTSNPHPNFIHVLGSWLELCDSQTNLMQQYLQEYETEAALLYVAIESGGGVITVQEKEAWSTAVKSFKENGTWERKVGVYPLLGSTAQAQKWNAKDPVDSDSSYRLVFQGSPQHTDQGFEVFTNGDYAETFISPGTDIPDYPQFSFSRYAKREVQDEFVDYRLSIDDSSRWLNFLPRWIDGNTYFDIGGNGGQGRVSASNSSVVGAMTTSRDVSNNQFIIRTGTTLVNEVRTSSTTPTGTIAIGAGKNSAGTITTRNEQLYSYVDVGSGITEVQALQDQTIINTFVSSIGREI